MIYKSQVKKRIPVVFSLIIVITACFLPCSYALESTTLHNGSRGEEVRELQQVLIDLGYLKGVADGIFGNKTENAVRQFQKRNKLTADGLAGTLTRTLILSKASEKSTSAVTVDSAASSPSSVTEQKNDSQAPLQSDPASVPSYADSLFSGNYTTIRYGNRGDRVKTLQSGLISAGFLKGKADGVFGRNTFAAVKAFQQSNHLSVDGIAGRKTLTALESTLKSAGSSSPSSASESASQQVSTSDISSDSSSVWDAEEINERISGPQSGTVQLLHWYNDIKPSLSNGQNLLVYDPSTGLNWTLRIIARGRHCDAEPLTAKDTHTMVKAFGGINTWNQKPVYVLLPGGTWTIGSTHDMPHDSGSIKNNDFNGHLCVHFLRDMEEAKKNDPNYGVSNQETIRSFWKKITGQDIDN